MRIAPLSVIAACCLTVACTAHAEEAASKSNDTSGETRQVEDFHGVAVGHGIKAQVKVGPKSVRLEGPAESVSRVRLVVEDGILTTEVDRKGMWSGLNGKVRLFVSSPKMTHVSASGGSHVDAEATAAEEFEAEASGGAELNVRGVDATEVDTDASGGAEVTLVGRAQKVEAEVSGGSQLHARKLQGVTELEVDASGGAVVELDAPGTVSGEASGGSVIHLTARPQRSDIEVSGGSRVDSGN
ncbi:GIN domain-containing protein [Corallococcus llansteffanensis]|uniref:DUF2807 domain-containing protein n=1 Tax=Corallococcus llansteffanensis TaxID=2316731 RepID=A0A3A8NQ07_9BACT|nr:DUF2807 domain-containing protein [Corallococcus llansteffanensis]RKH45470.1 DUF2807 domain-containing protein [Corallococcus llansteffanensis]